MNNGKRPQKNRGNPKENLSTSNLQTKKTYKRLDSIDFLKGFAIIAVYFYHLSNYWVTSSWAWFNPATLFYLDVLGPSLFLFLSALAVTFSAKRREANTPKAVIRNRILTRGLLLMLISAPLNVYFCLNYDLLYSSLPIPLTLWGYNIIFFIGLAQIVSYLSYRLGKKASLILGLVIIFLGPTIREIVYLLNVQMLNQGKFNLLYFLLHYFITSPIPQLPLFPWISICFISTVFGEILYDAWNAGTEEKLIEAAKTFFISGITFLAFGIILGITIYTPETLNSEIYRYILLMDDANRQTIFPGVYYTGIFDFLIRSRGANMLYLTGVSLLFIALGLYFLDVKGKANPFINMNIFYGKISLSLYLFVEFFAFIFSNVFPLWYFVIFYIVTTAFAGFFLYIWKKYFWAVGTPEWIIGKCCSIVQDYTHKRLEKNSINNP